MAKGVPGGKKRFTRWVIGSADLAAAGECAEFDSGLRSKPLPIRSNANRPGLRMPGTALRRRLRQRAFIR